MASAFYFQKLLELNPLNVEAYYGLGVAYEYAGDFEKANDCLSIIGELELEDSEKLGRVKKMRERNTNELC